jgi:HlyB family type I secretion system ABC transporter
MTPRDGLLTAPAGDAATPLDAVPLLQMLPPAVRRAVASHVTTITYGFGDVIVREGEPADAFFLLTSGRARVVKAGEGGEEVPLNVLRAGDYFGEVALLHGGSRTATVRSSSEVTALRLARDDFQRLVQEIPELRDALELRVRHRALHNFLREFSALGELPLPVLRRVLEGLRPVAFAAGELIVREGEPAGPLFIVQSGRARVFRDAGGRAKNLAFLRAGDFFGERSTLLGVARNASVQAITECQLLALAPAELASLAADHPELRRVLDERMAQYNADVEARVPLDFAEEMLPADVAVHDKLELPESRPAGDAAGEGAGEEQAAEGREEDEEPFATPEGLFRKRRRRIFRFPLVLQVDEMDCGAACLAMICRHFGRRVSITRIRQLAHTAYDGTSLKALCSAANELGLAARGLKVSRRHLDRMPVPAIIHWDDYHWVVLVGVSRRSVRVADPAIGLRTIPRAEFERRWNGYAALFDYTEAFARAPEGRSSGAWAIPFVTAHKGVLLRVLLLAIVASVLQMLLPVFTQVIVDRVVVERDVGLLNLVIVGMLVALAFMLGANLIQRYMLSFATVRIDAAILDFLTRRLLALPMSYFHTRRTGDIQRRLMGARQVREFIVQNGINGMLAVVQITVALAVMAVYSPTLTLVFLAAAPAYAGLGVFSTKVLRPLFAELEESYGKYASFQVDAIKGIETVKATAAELTFRDKMLAEFTSVADRQFRANFVMLAYDTVTQAVSLVSTALFLLVGARMVIAGEITIGGFVAFNALIAMAYASVVRVLSLWDEWQLSAVLLDRLNDIFESDPEQGRDRGRLHPVPTLGGRIELRNVGFRYGGPEAAAILGGITLEIPAGRTTAIIGRSGCGKTTLIKCLSGLIEPTEGDVLFDGVDMKTLNYRELRRKIGVVLQENYMFSDTILRNIAFGDHEPDPDRAIWAAQLANAHDFILRLPLGYETRIGESGLAISGGQRQRIAIARALYSNPPILIFDEATSALDSESERAIQENMERLLSGRTAIVIAHRLSTIRHAHSIVVLEKGQVAERGTHDELMARRGLYFYLCSQQLGM